MAECQLDLSVFYGHGLLDISYSERIPSSHFLWFTTRTSEQFKSSYQRTNKRRHEHGNDNRGSLAVETSQGFLLYELVLSKYESHSSTMRKRGQVVLRRLRAL